MRISKEREENIKKQAEIDKQNAIKELEESGNLMIEFLEEGKKQKGDFHLVIISTQLQLPTPVKIVGEQLGLKLAKNIDSTEDLSLQQTEKEGISVAGGVTLG